MNVIEARGLSHRYGSTVALHSLNLSIPRGEIYGLLGLNGAGKTTTVRILTTDLEPTSGTASIEGIPVSRPTLELRRKLGVVIGENVSLEPSWSPVRYLRFFGAMYGLTRAEADARARDLFTRLRLSESAERPIGKLSGGNRRKVEIARALLHRPTVLFLDEPTRELDIPSKEATWDTLQDLRREGMTVFLSSHDVHEVERLCDRIGVLRKGRVVWEGAPRAVPRLGTLSQALAGMLEGSGASFEPAPSRAT